MNIQKFGKTLARAFRHLQIAGQGAKPKSRLAEAGELLSEAAEEIDLALIDLEMASHNEQDRADLREAATQILEAIQLISLVHARLA
jgi:hypothetical protein